MKEKEWRTGTGSNRCIFSELGDLKCLSEKWLMEMTLMIILSYKTSIQNKEKILVCQSRKVERKHPGHSLSLWYTGNWWTLEWITGLQEEVLYSSRMLCVSNGYPIFNRKEDRKTIQNLLFSHVFAKAKEIVLVAMELEQNKLERKDEKKV